MKRIALLVLVALGVAGLSALGIWQIERRAWKLALIERVEQRRANLRFAFPDNFAVRLTVAPALVEG